MQIIDSTPAALSADLQMYLRNGDVFFDIETTGLSWRTSHLYLIGALFFDPAADTFTLRQWFLDRPAEEKEMLVSFFTFLSDVKRLVHFNGTTFDLPYLTHKALFYQMEDPLSSIASLDLYQALRPFQSILGLSSMKQKNVEQYLSFPRKDQLNGKQLISVFHDYLQTLDEKKLELLFLHNYDGFCSGTARASCPVSRRFFCPVVSFYRTDTGSFTAARAGSSGFPLPCLRGWFSYSLWFTGFSLPADAYGGAEIFLPGL